MLADPVVRLVAVATPRTGVMRVGEVFKTVLPDPVDVVTPVPPLATGRTPEKAVALWNVGAFVPLLVKTYPVVEEGMETKLLEASVATTCKAVKLASWMLVKTPALKPSFVLELILQQHTLFKVFINTSLNPFNFQKSGFIRLI